MIVWRGLGSIVMLLWVVSLVAAIFVVSWLGLKGQPQLGIVCATFGILDGVVIWLVAKKVEGKEPQIFIDKQTGQEVVLRGNAGSLFFIPTRYWAFVSVVAGIALGFSPLWLTFNGQ